MGFQKLPDHRVVALSFVEAEIARDDTGHDVVKRVACAIRAPLPAALRFPDIWSGQAVDRNGASLPIYVHRTPSK